MADSYAVSARRSGAATATVSNGTAAVEVGGPGLTPVELLLGSVASCMLATMVDHALRNAIPSDDLHVEVSGEMANRPRRVGVVRAVVHVGPEVSAEQAEALLRAAHRCPVHTTLEQQPRLEISLAS
ncbi:hypothetical protein GUY44_12600 [Pimelobacter simplex]|uniref:Uncharacterized protein n=1 Tax=Nocardioides simplex TaxID=2045 RepID=A0A0A1DHX3_NOCSI|nr:OsmC family protein [Pimelobacter simplex]AIY16232.1 hypothetical protein KR76_04685 [Pimelobacter simplex]MCG8151322.1 hypothetical protein [Pimelobacter simplex]GEB12127.1 hypothetical protein NSI01_04420 [Pimelobacter simplex]SFN17591.1 Uncharacterized OsmC-related protein [Pimelobacter simplex]